MPGVDKDASHTLQVGMFKKVFALNVTIANNRERNNIY